MTAPAFATMRAIRTITASCDRAIAKSAPPKQSVELQKAILEGFKEKGRIAHHDCGDYTALYVPDRDENGPYCSEILALETSDGKRHFWPYPELQKDWVRMPDPQDITDELREEERGE